MAFIISNPNPHGSYVGDCVIRAISIIEDKPWDEIYLGLAIQGFIMGDMPSSNRVWNEYLKSRGYKRYIVSNDCPECYTIKDFCGEHFKGKYILGTGSHAVAVIDGNWIDTWNSADEQPIYYWTKEA